jgi:hypothetical protein
MRPFECSLQQAFHEDRLRFAEQQREAATAGRSVTGDPKSAQFLRVVTVCTRWAAPRFAKLHASLTRGFA